MQVVEVTTFMEIPDDWTSLDLSDILMHYVELIEKETEIEITWQFIEPVSKGEDNE